MGPVLQNFPLYAEGSHWAPTHPKMTPTPPVTPHSSTSCTHHHSWGRTQISCHDMLHVRARRSLMQKPDGGNISHCYISVIKRDGRKREQTSVGLQSSTTISCMPRRAQTLHYETEFFKAGFGAEKCWQKQNDRNHSSRSRHLSTALMAAGDASPWQPRLQWNCCLRNYGSDDGRAGRLNNKRSSCSSLAVYALCLHEILEINRNENLCQIWSITKPITEPQCLTPLWSDEGPEQKSQLQGCSQKTQGKDFLAGSGGLGTSDLMVALNNLLHKSTASVLPAPKLSKKHGLHPSKDSMPLQWEHHFSLKISIGQLNAWVPAEPASFEWIPAEHGESKSRHRELGHPHVYLWWQSDQKSRWQWG